MKPQIRRATMFAGLTAMFVVAFAATRPPAKGVTYRLRMTSKLPAVMAQMNGDPGGPVILAKVKSVGNRARLEFINPAPGVGLDDYVLIDSVRAILVNAAEKTFSEAPAALSGGGGLGMLSSMAGGARRGGRGGRGGGGDAGNGGGIPNIDITGLVTDVQQLDGDTLQGRQVRHYQMVAEMNVMVMGNLAPLRIESEIWTADLPFAIVNPFDFTGTVSPDDPMAKLTSKLLEMRKQIKGTPLKNVMNLTITLGNGAVPLEFQQTTAITDIRETDVDVKELEVPAGFTKKAPGGPGSSR